MEVIKMNKKIILIGIGIAMLMLNGCMEGVSQPFDQTLKTPPVEQKPAQSSANRFQGTNPEGSTAAESAIELSKKYAAIVEEAGKLKLENQNLQAENTQLAQTVTALQTELNQAKKELSQANDMLIDMRVELNNWKADVIGFREEIRKADKVQLETLIKILKVLGGEVQDDLASELQSQTNQSNNPSQ